MRALGAAARRSVFALWLVVVWIVLWGGLTWANLVGGVLVVVVLLALVPMPPDPAAGSGSDPVRFHPLAAISLLCWFTWKLVAANVTVAVQALRPPGSSRIRTAIVAVPLPGCPPATLTAVANIITLTPGTLTMEVDARASVLYVHELTFTTADAVRRDVYEIERRVVAAFGSASARDASASRPLDGSWGEEARS